MLAARPAGESQWRALVQAGAQGGDWRAAGVSGGRVARLCSKRKSLERGQFGERLLEFAPVDDFFAVLERIGHMPLPPYIHRDDAEADRERYQTVFAQRARFGGRAYGGAALYAEMLEALAANGVEIARVTLHVGLGTFAPLRVERVDEVRLHRERYTISAVAADALNRAVAEGRRIVAVGTTVVRTLEAAALEAARGETIAAAFRCDGDLYLAGIRVPPGERAADQLSSAAIEPADAGERVRRARARACRLSARG